MPTKETTDRSSTRQTILVADPARSAIRVCEGLSKRGCNVWHAADLVGAMSIVRARSPQWVVTERRLLGGSALDLIDCAKVSAPSTGVIVVSAYPTIASTLALVRAGATDCLSKPVSVSMLLSAMGIEESATGSSQGADWLSRSDAGREYVHEVFDLCGTLSGTARALGVDRSSLRRMLQRFARVASAPGDKHGTRGVRLDRMDHRTDF
jgi:ActR/RegA family two-component response regulator